MSVYFEPNKKPPRWRVDFIWTDQRGAKTRIRRTAFDAKGRRAQSKTAAEAAEQRIRAALVAGTFELEKAPATEPTEGATLRALRERYFADHVAKLKPSMQSGQERLWRVWLLPHLGDVPLASIDAEAMARLVKAMQANELSAKTVNNCLSALRTALTHAEDWGLVAAVPRFRWLKVAQQSFDFFTFDEAAKLVEVAPPMVTVALKSGIAL